MINSGLIYALLAYFLWGLSPFFWKLIDYVPVDEVLGHRVVWTVLTACLILSFRKKANELRSYVKSPKNFQLLFLSSLLIGTNWFIYTYAVTQSFVIEASLGYFINPLLSVFLGVVFLNERPSLTQSLAIFLAFIGVAYLAWSLGRLPIISLSLAFTFGLYGLIKKKVSYPPLEGMALESALLLPAAIFFLLYKYSHHELAFGHTSLRTDFILALTGIVTLTPLVCFAAAAKKLPLTFIGLFQYIAPTMQFILGVFYFKEAFSQEKLIGFLFIWMALFFFIAEQLFYTYKNLKGNKT